MPMTMISYERIFRKFHEEYFQGKANKENIISRYKYWEKPLHMMNEYYIPVARQTPSWKKTLKYIFFSSQYIYAYGVLKAWFYI